MAPGRRDGLEAFVEQTRLDECFGSSEQRIGEMEHALLRRAGTASKVHLETEALAGTAPDQLPFDPMFGDPPRLDRGVANRVRPRVEVLQLATELRGAR